MRIVHRICRHFSKEELRQILALGIDIRDAFRAPISFDVDESHPGWKTLEQWISEWDASHSIYTVFSKAELASASNLELRTTWAWAYPQPDDDNFGFLSATYDLTDYCDQCGIGALQTRPFRVTKEPKWGTRHISQLYYVGGAVFVSPEIWDTVFRPFAIECLPVLQHRTGRPLSNVVQLHVSREAESPLRIPSTLPCAECPQCARRKYHWPNRGYFPPFAQPQTAPLIRTQEVFGSGMAADNAIVISADVFRAIENRKLKGFKFVPLAY